MDVDVFVYQTRLFATNSMSFLSQCDEVFMLESGCVVEKGSYAQLLDNNAHFAEFIRAHLCSKSSDNLRTLESSNNNNKANKSTSKKKEASGVEKKKSAADTSPADKKNEASKPLPSGEKIESGNVSVVHTTYIYT